MQRGVDRHVINLSRAIPTTSVGVGVGVGGGEVGLGVGVGGMGLARWADWSTVRIVRTSLCEYRDSG